MIIVIGFLCGAFIAAEAAVAAHDDDDNVNDFISSIVRRFNPAVLGIPSVSVCWHCCRIDIVWRHVDDYDQPKIIRLRSSYTFYTRHMHMYFRSIIQLRRRRKLHACSQHAHIFLATHSSRLDALLACFSCCFFHFAKAIQMTANCVCGSTNEPRMKAFTLMRE